MARPKAQQAILKSIFAKKIQPIAFGVCRGPGWVGVRVMRPGRNKHAKLGRVLTKAVLDASPNADYVRVSVVSPRTGTVKKFEKVRRGGRFCCAPCARGAKCSDGSKPARKRKR